MRKLVWRNLAAIITTGLIVGASSAAMAAVPNTLTHQGRLYDSAGKPINDTVPMTFNFYDAPNDPVPKVSETIDVTLEDGFFSVSLGDINSLTGFFDGSTKYFGIAVGNDAEMTPRVVIQSVPYAILSGDVVGDIHPTSVIVNGTTVIDGTGKWVGDPTGLVGPTGPAGANGATGPAGANGMNGTNGTNGMNGATGPTGPAGANGANGAQGPTGAVGPTGPNGANGANGATGAVGPTGPAGATGAAGATGIVSTVFFGGYVSAIPANGTGWVFAGGTANVTTTATQRLTGAAEAPMGFAAGAAAAYAEVDLCYKPTAGPTLINFSGGFYSIHRFLADRRPYTGTGTVVPGAGTWTVGLCVYNFSAAVISDNDYTNGWVHVTN